MSLGPAHVGYLILRARLRFQRLRTRCACVSGIPLSCSSSAAGGLRGCFRTQYHITIRRKRNLRNPSRTMLPSSLSQRCCLPLGDLSKCIKRATTACHHLGPSSPGSSLIYPWGESFLQKRGHACGVRDRTRYAPHAGSSCFSPRLSMACVKNARLNNRVEGSV
jgi:hypothetical protein